MSLIAAAYSAILGLKKRTWVSGMTVKKNEIVKSPADNEDYERITATGGGTTDPADDITNYVARSYVRTAALPPPPLLGVVGASFYGATTVAHGTLAVGVRTQVLSISGRGVIDYLAAYKGATGTFRVEVIVDGRTVSDETLTMATANAALYIGSPAYYGDTTNFLNLAARQHQGLVFKRSFTVYMTAVVTQTTTAKLAYNVRSEA
jgi:hypothetical protein